MVVKDAHVSAQYCVGNQISNLLLNNQANNPSSWICKTDTLLYEFNAHASVNNVGCLQLYSIIVYGVPWSTSIANSLFQAVFMHMH